MSTPAPPPLVETKDNLNFLPRELREFPRWLTWDYQMRPARGGELKPTKVPLQPRLIDGREVEAKSTDPNTWGSFPAAAAFYLRHRKRDGAALSGLGLALGDGIAGIDIDHCIDPPLIGDVAPWAMGIVEAMDTYTEVSPSGTGVKIFFRATMPEDAQGHVRPFLEHGPDCRAEFYWTGRYFTVTGARLAQRFDTVRDRQREFEDVHRLLFAKQYEVAAAPKQRIEPTNLDDISVTRVIQSRPWGGKFDALMNGQWEGSYGSQSQADQALCNFIATFSGDAAQIDRIFRTSALYRPKWDQIHVHGLTYGQATIEHALNRPSLVQHDAGRSFLISRFARTAS
jgi:primase-polymerase (primpol)-like protein